MKNARVKIIKDNIQVGSRVPNFEQDCDVGQWVDHEMAMKGHQVDKTGLVDLPVLKVDNKSRKKGSHAYHTVGSMTNDDILATADFKQTRWYHKVQNQNQITYDPDFLEVTNVSLIDFDTPVAQQKLAEGYTDCRQQLANGSTAKEIKSKNGWVVFDRYGHQNSCRMRITNTAMKKIHNLSGARDQILKHFEEVEQ
jgi:hypothetical protein